MDTFRGSLFAFLIFAFLLNEGQSPGSSLGQALNCCSQGPGSISTGE